jgi:hypothetical protein
MNCNKLVAIVKILSFDCLYSHGFILSHLNKNQNDLQQTIGHPTLDQTTPALTVQPFQPTEKQ